MALAKYFPFMSDSRPLTSVRPLEVRTGEFAGKLESAEQKAREENLDGESFFRTFGPLVRKQLAQGVSKQEILQAALIYALSFETQAIFRKLMNSRNLGKY